MRIIRRNDSGVVDLDVSKFEIISLSEKNEVIIKDQAESEFKQFHKELEKNRNNCIVVVLTD